jgi:threonine/homoserine/homoserine lactone efflux protein
MGMHPPLFLKGLAFGLSIAAPVGPIGILCIRRSLKDGMLSGLFTGLGAAAADATYGCVAAFGLTSVSYFLVGHRRWVALLGGAFLCVLGMRTFLSKPPPEAAPDQPRSSLLGALGSTFLLTLANPATILSFAAVFAAYGLGLAPGYSSAAWLVLGVFVGSAAWWLFLSSTISRLRSRMTPPRIAVINRLSGAILLTFGLWAIARR